MRCKVLFILVALIKLSSTVNGQKTVELSVGDRMPNLNLGEVINYSSENIAISDLQGKAVILDFWAPWCTPCLDAFSKLDSLQKKYNKKLHILPVTQENRDFSNRLLNNLKKIRGIDLTTTIVEDTLLSRLFKHKLIPHYVWINDKGYIKAITGTEEVTESNVLQLIQGKELNLPIKSDTLNVFPERNVPFFGAKQIDQAEDLMYHSVFSKYLQNVVMTSAWSNNRILCTNHTIKLLYKIAFGKFEAEFMNDSRIVLENFHSSADSIMIGWVTAATRNIWKEKGYENVYSYEIYNPDSSLTREQIFELMQSDVNRFFSSKGIKGEVQKRKIKAVVLTTSGGSLDKLKTKGGEAVDNYSDYFLELRNQPLRKFLIKMQAYFPNSNSLPLLDYSGYRENIDIEINADLRNLKEVDKQLQKYGLRLVEKDIEMEMIVITKYKLDKMALKD